MHYDGNIIRPPSEADSIILQVTTGCSHNKCTFCGAYKEKKFTIKPAEVISEDIEFASTYCKRQKRVFLADGNALILPQKELISILQQIREKLPWVNKVSLYGTGKSVLKKTHQQLQELKSIGLNRIYLGLESGDDTVLKMIKKGETAESMVEACDRLKQHKFFISLTVLLGIANRIHSEEHARLTGEVLNRIEPNQVAALTYIPLENTELGKKVLSGESKLFSSTEILIELKQLLYAMHQCKTQFFANHASNYLPVTGRLPRDREKLIEMIEQAINGEAILKAEHLRGL